MNLRRNSRHSMEALLPVILFCVFTLCAVLLIVLSADIYRRITDNSFLNNSARTSISYITNKIHRADSLNRVEITTFENSDAIVLKQQKEDEVYNTYIYVYEGYLRELFVKEGAEAYGDSGTKILKAENFTAEFTEDNLIYISCTTSSGDSCDAVVGLKTA